ncbi:UDP-2,3-diacylglucosamine diphosphatase [Paraferrimonas sp. SM1919]|uniref:UDP-2,3-diacylglucosamine diphosphatase n=1 Tax=Paraferrimonas sp. SM1919 TaxID=2662263 RepID=UPI0013CFEE09|nr:UDP-2,3-diacylglucosamine diphosphatase [Paraferrimonas sp. SM1919]
MLNLSFNKGKVVFIGDLHLSADRPDINSAFDRFLANLEEIEALFIMGDLFEVWIGDDIAEPFALELANKLKKLSTQFPIYFTHGNRDFMLGKRYAELSGMTLLEEDQTIDLFGNKAVVLHGDSLCTLDEAYQKFRRFRNQAWARAIYNALPKMIRRRIAANIRANSKAANQGKTYEVMDVTPQAVTDKLQQYQVQWLIHGHTHRPKVHTLANLQKRFVVGDWYEQCSVLTIDKNGYQLSTSPL